MDHIGKQIKTIKKYNKTKPAISAVFNNEILEMLWYSRIKSLKSPSPLLSVFSSGLRGLKRYKFSELWGNYYESKPKCYLIFLLLLNIRNQEFPVTNSKFMI